MRKPLLFALMSLFCRMSVYSKDYVTLIGKVTDEDGKPIKGAKVFISGKTQHIAITDANGHFMIEEINPGSYRVKANIAGYDTLDGDLWVSNQLVNTISIILKNVGDSLNKFKPRKMRMNIEFLQ